MNLVEIFPTDHVICSPNHVEYTIVSPNYVECTITLSNVSDERRQTVVIGIEGHSQF